MKIDTGIASAAPVCAKSDGLEDFNIDLSDWAIADRHKRQIKETLEAFEALEEIERYWAREGLLVDRLWMDHPDMARELDETFKEFRDVLKYASQSGAPVTAQPPKSSTATKATKMFAIDTSAGDSGGMEGPFYSFKPKGSVIHGLPLNAWYMREKDGDHWVNRHDRTIEEKGVVLDLFATPAGELGGTLQLGWTKSDGQKGVAPERKWWASPLRAEPRPDESRTEAGGYQWANSFSVRCAMGGGKAATLTADGWGAYRGFSNLLGELNSGFAENIGLCPLVRVTAHEQGKNTNHPVFAIVKWVPRPDCLKADAPSIATEPAPAPKAAPQPAPAPAPETADADLEF